MRRPTPSSRRCTGAAASRLLPRPHWLLTRIAATVALLAARSNRSAAFLKLGKARQALADADVAVTLRPDWEKGHFRRGAALEARRASRHATAQQRTRTCIAAARVLFSRARSPLAAAHPLCNLQLLERPADAVAALEQAATLAGGATKDITARLKVLRRWVNSGVKPAAAPIAAPPAPLAPPPASASASGFAFKPAPKVLSGSGKGASPPSWADAAACERLSAAASAALRTPDAALAALAAARAGRGDAAALATALAEACLATGTAEGWALLGAPLFAVFGKAPGRRREAAVALEAFRAQVRPFCFRL